jgi:hypothetical protein
MGRGVQPSRRFRAAISAASARDVTERAWVDDRTQPERSRPGKMARAAARRNGSASFAFPEREQARA